MFAPAAPQLMALKGNASRFSSVSAATMRSNTLPPLQGVTVAPPLPDYLEPSKTKITTLPNGVKIASETSPGPVASIGLYVDCGSVYETEYTIGATQLLEKMAFKSTTNQSHLQLVREVEATGGNVTVLASREHMGYSYDGLKTYVPQMLELLVDSVRNPLFRDCEIDEQIVKIDEDIDEAANNPQGLLFEKLQSVAYYGALQNSLFIPECFLFRLDGRMLEEFVAENYTAPRMVLAASGVDHEEFLSIAEPLLSDLPAVSRPMEPHSSYGGGICTNTTISAAIDIALAFEVPGGWKTEKDAMTSTVLQEHKFAPQAVEIMAREFHEVATPGKVKQVDLDRAKSAIKSAVLMNLESRMIASEDIGRQILTYGERKPVSYFLNVSAAAMRSNTLPSLQGVTVAPPLPDHLEPSKTKITTLPNGVKIASETSPGPAASIGLYVDCGSVYETDYTIGATQLLEKMAFKSTTNRSHLQLVREVEATGGNVTVLASREHMGYSYDGLKTYVPQMLELLVDSVRNPIFRDCEIDEQILKIKEDIAEAVNNPQGVLFEKLQSAPYSGALKNSLFIPECFLFRMDGTMLDEFVAENYTAPRMVLAASGVDHEEFLSIAEPLLSDLPAVSRPVEPHSSYVGGICFNTTISAAIDIALAFEVPGGWKTEKDAMTSTVLQVFVIDGLDQMLMGGGGSFTAGGPGKRMFLPLHQRVLNEYQEIKSFSAFNIIFNSTGIFGIHAITEHKFAPQAVEIMAREFHEVATPGKVKQVDLDRAKSAIKSAVLMNLESRMVASEDIGRQILTYGERKPVSYFLKALDAVTLEDIASTAQKLISSPVTMGTIGDVEEILNYRSVKSMFH